MKHSPLPSSAWQAPPASMIMNTLFIIMLLITLPFVQSFAQYELPAYRYRNDTGLVRTRIAAAEKIQDTDSAIAAFKLLLPITAQHRLDEETADILARLGALYLNKDERSTAKSYLHRGINLALTHGIKGKALHRLYNNLALVCYDNGENDSAILYHLNNINIARRMNLKIEEARSYNNLGPIFLDLKDFKQATYYVKKSLQISEQADDYELICSGYLVLGTIYIQKTDTVDSILNAGRDWLFKGLSIAEAHNDPALSRKFLNAIGIFYRRKELYKEVIYYSEKALALKGGRTSDQAPLLVNLSTSYALLGNYSKAEEMAVKALDNVRQANRTNFYGTAYFVLAYIYSLRGKYKEASEHYHESIRWLEKSYNESTRAKVQNLRFQYETAQKDRDLVSKQLKITQQQAQMDKNRIVAIALVAISLLIALAVWLYFRYRYRIHKQQEQQAREIAAWKASLEGEEKERGRLARELHDNIGGNLSTLKMWLGNIRNNMNSHLVIQDQEYSGALKLLDQTLTKVRDEPDLATLKIWLGNIRNNMTNQIASQEQDYNGALHLLDHALTEVRNTAHHLMPELLLRLGLADAIRIYCSDIQLATGIKVRHEALGDIAPLDNNIDLLVYRMVQELVQNVVKHARATELLVQLIQFNQTLYINIEDNGQGMPAAQESELPGMGLPSIRDSVTKLKGKFTLQSEPGKGTTVALAIPYETQPSLSKPGSID